MIAREGLQAHSLDVGNRLQAELQTLAAKYPCVGDVRGAGLFIGFELVSDRECKTPDKALALEVIEALRDRCRRLIRQRFKIASAAGVPDGGYRLAGGHAGRGFGRQSATRPARPRLTASYTYRAGQQ